MTYTVSSGTLNPTQLNSAYFGIFGGIKYSLYSYFSIFWIFPISGFADNQYLLLSEHGGQRCRRLVAAS